MGNFVSHKAKRLNAHLRFRAKSTKTQMGITKRTASSYRPFAILKLSVFSVGGCGEAALF